MLLLLRTVLALRRPGVPCLRTALRSVCSTLQPLRGLRVRTDPQFSMVVPLRSQARLWHSLLHWGLRTGLRFAGPVFRGCGALRAVLTPSPLRGFDGFGLFRAQRAAFVRPCANACAVFRVCGCPLGMSSTLQPFGPPGSHRSSIQHGRPTALTSSLVALPASLGLLRPVSRTARGLRAPLR